MCAAASVSPSAPTPVIARIWSVAQLPASRPAPVQARKSAGRGKNPFLFAMLFEKNIEIFSDPNPSVLCVFSICLPPFRAWTLGAGREAGSWQADTGRELTGDQTFTAAAEGWVATGSGAFGASTLEFNTLAITGGTSSQTSAYNFRASRVWGNHSGVEFAPVHIWQPCIVYLGNSA